MAYNWRNKQNLVDYRKVPRTHFAGRSFASKLEAALYGELLLRVSAGEIQELRCQPHVFLTEAHIEMIPDYSYFDIDTQSVEYAEAKGMETDIWRLKLKLWRFYGPGRLKIYKGSARSFKMVEEVYPRGLK